MSLLLHLSPLMVLSGFVVGCIVGLTGVGGGSLMTPVLILLFGIHPASAVGTDLIYASATKTGGTLVHGWHRSIHWPLVLRLAAGSLPASALTLAGLHLFAADQAAVNAMISKVLGVALILTAVGILFRQRLLARYGARIEALGDGRIRNLTIATGAVLGILVTLSSVGAGALGVTALLLLYPRLPVRRIVGSDIAHAVPLTLMAGAGHLAMGHIDWAVLASLLLGSLPGIVLASNLAPKLPEKALQYGLSAILLIVSFKLVR